jgi:regulator of protease activity HflC (stomatin/prohibitin superfamily)
VRYAALSIEKGEVHMGIALIVAVIILALVFGGAAAAYKTQKTARIFFGAVSGILLIVFFILPWSIVTISTGEIGAVRVFGEARRTITAGIHFVPWVTSTTEVYDIKTREIKLNFQAYSKDAQTVTGSLAIQYQIMPEMVLDITRQYGSIFVLEEKLKAIIIERAKSVFADKGAMVIVESRSVLSGEIEQRISPMMDQYYVVVTTVALEDISFNDAFETAVEQKMVAEQEKLRAEYDKERAIIKGEEHLAVAELEAQAVIQRAQGDAEALRIMQGAWDSLSAEVKEAMLRQMFYEKWNGILPEVMAGDSLDLILDRSSNSSSAPVTPNAGTP